MYSIIVDIHKVGELKTYELIYSHDRSVGWRIKVAIGLLLCLFIIALFGGVITSILGLSDGQVVDLTTVLSSPSTDHPMGTDALGRDVAAILIGGTRTALFIGLGAVGLAAILGLMVGMKLGYYGDDRWSVYISDICYLAMWLVGLYLINHVYTKGTVFAPGGSWKSWCLLISLLWTGMNLWLARTWPWGGHMKWPVDSLGMRMLDFWKGLPKLLILLVVMIVVKPGYPWGMLGLIGVLMIPNFALHARAETLKHRSSPSLQRAIQEGRGDLWILRHAILPHVVRPLLVKAAFSVGAVVLLEATLAFLGLGLPVDHESWGGLIRGARDTPEAWWLVIYPALFLIGWVWSAQEVGRWYEHRLQSRQSLIQVRPHRGN